VSPAEAWRRILAAVTDHTGLKPEPPGRVGELIDLVTAQEPS